MRYNELGEELPDDTPLEIPAGMRRPLTLQEQIQQAVRGALSASAGRHEAETFEEANDFDVDDDEFEDVMTQHEYRDMKSEIPEDARKAFEEWRSKRKSVPVPGVGGGEAEEVPDSI